MLAAFYPLFVWLDIAWVGAGVLRALVSTALVLLWGCCAPRLLDPLRRRKPPVRSPRTTAVPPGRIASFSDVIAAVAKREPPRSQE